MPLSLTSCNWFDFGYNGDYSTSIVRSYHDNIDYIAKRSFSLRFISSDVNVRSTTYGTGWIFAKENDSNTPDNYYDDTYYLATNLHVAAAINNGNNFYYEWDDSNKRYESVIEPKYTHLQLGQIIVDNKLGTNYTVEPINNTIYTAQVSLNNVSIAYTSFDLFKNMDINNIGNVYNESTLNNGTMDLAILKVDFSQIKYNNKVSNSKEFIHQSLDAYNQSPTKIGTYSDGQNITIGGFPYKENQYLGGGTWNSAYHPTPYKGYNTGDLSKVNIVPGYLFSASISNDWKYYYQKSDAKDVSSYKRRYVLPNNIAYLTDEYASYVNIALQAHFANVNLTGGSSGSLAMNDNNEIVGIYWGGYENALHSIGVIDLFINNITYKNKNQTVLKPYNIVEDFIEQFPNTNLNSLYNL